MVDGFLDGMAPNPVGDRLRTAREAKGMTLDEVASMTRVPTRHLQHIEKGEWDSLPAITYSVGFARAYAKAVGLNGSEVGSELRAQLGGGYNAASPSYEPADPARVPPRSLAIAAGVIALLLLAGYLIWRSNAVPDADPLAEAAAVDTPIGAPPPAAATNQARPAAPSSLSAGGPVVLSAREEVWLRVYEPGGGAALFQGVLKPGERFVVPPSAQRPMIRTGRANALQVTVGSTAIPPLGPPERTIADVSLAPTDLLARVGGTAPAAPRPQGR